MGIAQSAYKYRGLEHADSIRLLHLSPAKNPKDDLRGSLVHTTLQERSQNLLEPYTALSYVWSSSEKTHSIRLDGQYMGITRSLDSALRDMRDAVTTRKIWADALCINQSDAGEKAGQVALMGRIYSTASHTIIHLPLATAETERIFDSALHLSNGGLSPSDTVTLAALQTEPEFDDTRRLILSAAWFTRAWVFQELVLSLDPWVQISSTSRARWADFCKVIGAEHVIPAMGLTTPLMNIPERHPNPFMDIAEPYRRMSAVPLYSLLAARRGIGVTDPRDIVYANLGIVSDAKDVCKYITVDYSRPSEALFYDTARYVLETAGFDYLIYQSLRGPEDGANRRNLNLAFWIPDWTCRARTNTSSDQQPRVLTFVSGTVISSSVQYSSPGNLFGQDQFELRQLAHELDRRLRVINLEIRGTHHLVMSDPPTLSFTGIVWDVIEGISAVIPELELPTIHFGDPIASVYTTPLKAFLDSRASSTPGAANGTSEKLVSSRLDEISSQASRAAETGVGMYHRTDVDKRGRLPKGRLAAGKNGSLHIVPEETREGHIVVEVGPSHIILVLRPLSSMDLSAQPTQPNPLDLRILNELEVANGRKGCVPQVTRPHTEATVTTSSSDFGYPKRVEWREKLNADDVIRVQHCKLMGEALCIQLVQTQIASFGWTPPPPNATVMDIFTLH
ncbi:heterokaryon incompatibility protein-domain-containing protein [Podospora aff. communis PSN243]|uniref:Heterokaryon incompatibility protein-domain-containing protein n=1 Tax=Podospora aff. communis PSN243 TaxID=3040156 RepID=A0AAV9GCV0_9PEZI|nr:heterokaryon incompatibility protein-domain-containing protein [Podospora aff. communis PSN243]